MNTVAHPPVGSYVTVLRQDYPADRSCSRSVYRVIARNANHIMLANFQESFLQPECELVFAYATPEMVEQFFDAAHSQPWAEICERYLSVEQLLEGVEIAL